MTLSLLIYAGNMIRADDMIAFRSTARLYCEEFATKRGVQEARSELWPYISIYAGNMIRADDTIAFRSTARLYCEEFATKTGVQEERSELWPHDYR